MADLPTASVLIDDTAGAFAGSTGYLVIMACVAQNADITPRVFASAKSALDLHGYSPGVDLGALHVDQTDNPFILVGLPQATAGVLGRVNSTGVTGSSALSVSAGPNGYMEETDCTLTVANGGTIGTNGITFDFSADGGRTTKRVRLGTANSYTVPYLGIVINFGAGTLNAGDTFSFTTTAPMWDGAGLTAARQALASQLKLARSWDVVGDLPNSTFGGYLVTEANAYETSVNRYVYARGQIRDRLPLAIASKITKRMTGAPTLTFAASGHTITRSAGSFISDGFALGDEVTVSGSTSNNGSYKITTLTDTVMTFASGLVDEGPVSNVAIVGSNSYVFSASAHTITRSGGSWLNDGFAAGDLVTISGTTSNNTSLTATNVTATVMTFASGLVDETTRSDLTTVSKGETMAQWVAAMDAAFTSIDGERRVDLALGRARMESPITGWSFRRPAAWAVSLREYQHDVQIATYRKSDGPLGCDMTDGNGKVVEFDERTDGGGLAGRFTCLRTYANGPNGAYVALSMTRAAEGSLLSRTHNMAVANVACTVVQAETENAIGQSLVLDDNGRAPTDSLQKIEERVNTALQNALLQQRAEGPRASKAVWSADKTAVLNVPGAELDGELDLEIDGTLEKIKTRVRVS